MATEEQLVLSTSSAADLWLRIRRGIALTFLVSVLATPLSYATHISLARVSQEAIGFFGLLLLLASFASTFFYFGGNSVIINYLPATPRQSRATFLVSYAVLTCAFIGAGTLLLQRFPEILPIVLGRDVGGSFLSLLPLIALLSVFQEATIATLKGLMDLPAAQLTLRISTVGYFVALGVLPWLAPDWFTLHMKGLVAASYVATTLLSLFVGLSFVRRHLAGGGLALAWHLPPGFWTFTSLTQLSSVLNFLNTRLDHILVLSLGGLQGLGTYFVLFAIAGAIALFSGFLLDAVFPSLTNVIANAQNDNGAVRRLYYHASRINQPLVTTLTLALLTGHPLLLSFFGPSYSRHSVPLLVLITLLGLNSLGTLNAYVLIAYRRSFRLLACQLVQTSSFVVLVSTLTGFDLLLRLAISQGVAILLGATMTALALPETLRSRPPREFWISALVIVATAVATFLRDMTPFEGFAIFLAAAAAFFLLGGYSIGEVRRLLSVSSPLRTTS